MADRDAYLTDPDSTTSRSIGCSSRRYAADLAAARIDAERATPAAASRAPRGGGTIWLGVVDGDGMCVSLIESNYGGLRLGRRRSRYRHPLPEPRRLLQPRRGPSERARAAQADAPHADARDALPRRPAVGRARVDGRRRAAADPRAGRVGPGRRRRGRRDGRRAAALVRRTRWSISRRPTRSAPSRDSPTASWTSWPRWAIRSGPTRVFEPSLGHCHAIELVDGGPADAGRSRRRRHGSAQRGPAGGPLRSRERGILARPRWRAAPRPSPYSPRARWPRCASQTRPRTGTDRLVRQPLEQPSDVERRPELPVHQRNRSRSRGRRSRAWSPNATDLGPKIAAETTPLGDEDERYVGLEMPDERLPRPAPRRRLRPRPARRVRRLRRHLRQDLPALTDLPGATRVRRSSRPPRPGPTRRSLRTRHAAG